MHKSHSRNWLAHHTSTLKMAKFLVYFLIFILMKSHLILAMAPSRKLGKHVVLDRIAESRPSPAEAPNADENGEFATEVSASGEEAGPVAQEEVMRINHHRRSIDKSVAGGGVILGGLATTFLVAVFCYIRATGRRSAEPGSPTNSDSSTGGRNGDPGSPVKS